jgi:hypothetical protein
VSDASRHAAALVRLVRSAGAAGPRDVLAYGTVSSVVSGVPYVTPDMAAEPFACATTGKVAANARVLLLWIPDAREWVVLGKVTPP